MAATWTAGITAAAGTRLTRPLFAKLFGFGKRLCKSITTQCSLLSREAIGKFSRLLRPVGPALMSQSASRGSHSHGPYALSAFQFFTLKTTLIRRSPILGRRSFWLQCIPASATYGVLASLLRAVHIFLILLKPAEEVCFLDFISMRHALNLFVNLFLTMTSASTISINFKMSSIL